MRFIHTADLHIGAAPDAGRPWAQERADAIAGALARIVDLTETERADLLLISGDLFHRQPLQRELREVNYQFSRLTNARVVLIAGNHDYITDSSPYLDFRWEDNVSFLSSPTMSSVYFDDIETEVHGFSYHRKEIREALYDDLRAPSDGRLHILLAHGGDASHIPIRLPALAASGYHYVALGHIHQPRIFKNTRLAYCGSPEPLDRTDLGVRGCLIGEVTNTGFSLRWKTISATQYRSLELEVTPETTQGELISRAEASISEHPQDIWMISLQGRRDPDMTYNTAAFTRLDRVLSAEDLTEPEYDLDALAEEHAGDLVAHYIQELNYEGADTRTRKALYYGLKALLDS